MKAINVLIFLFFIIASVQAYSQSSYFIGTSQASIEPDQSLISLHLGGYGAPRDGRFTLQWINKTPVPETVAMEGSDNKLFIAGKGNIMLMDLSENNSVWKSVARYDNIKAIAVADGKLLSMNNKGELLESKSLETIKWKTIGSVDESVVALSAAGNKLYAANGKGLMWVADLSGKSIVWTKLKTTNNIISIAANKEQLYALTGEGIIYKYQGGKDPQWLKIAYRNGVTIKEDIRHIAIVNDRLFGISNDNFLYMGEHRSEGNLTARAMAIRNGEKTVVIVNVDVCGLNDIFTGLVKKEIYEKSHIPASAIFINSAHTHFAPVSQNWFTWQEPNQLPDSTYLYSTIKNGILMAIDNALKTMAPAELYFGRGSVDIGYNRSLKDHQEIYDSAVDVIKVDFSGNDKESYLILAACHPVFSTAGTLHYTISANYPGVLRNLVEERTNTSNSLFLQGTAGDINPKDDGEYITGERLSNEVIAILNRPMTKLEGQISYYLDTINLPVTPWSNEKIAAYRADNSTRPGEIYSEKNVKWCDLMMKYKANGTMPSSMPVYVNTINIGNWKLVGFSRETTTGYGLGVKKLWPDKLISVAGYTNDVSSYLPTHMHIDAQTYEGLDSFFWYGMPNVFPENVDEIILNRIKSLER